MVTSPLRTLWSCGRWCELALALASCSMPQQSRAHTRTNRLADGPAKSMPHGPCRSLQELDGQRFWRQTETMADRRGAAWFVKLWSGPSIQTRSIHLCRSPQTFWFRRNRKWRISVGGMTCTQPEAMCTRDNPPANSRRDAQEEIASILVLRLRCSCLSPLIRRSGPVSGRRLLCLHFGD